MNIADVLSGAAGLEGVQWALCGPAMRKVLRGQLAALLPPGQLGVCRLDRAKFKPGRKLTGYYNVDLRAPGAAPDTRPIAVTWTPPGSKDLGPPSPELLEMQAEAVERGTAAPFQQLVAADPRSGLRVQVSPLDTDFPQLVRLSDPRHVQAMIAAVYAQENGAAPPLPARYVITPIRYRPGQRHVLRYDPAGDDGQIDPAGTLFAKLYEGQAGADAVRVAGWVADQLDAARRGVRGLRPKAYIPADAVVLYPRVVGTPLSAQLQHPDARAAMYLHNAGAALRALHAAPVPALAGLEAHDFAKEIRAISRAAEHVAALLPDVGASIQAMLDRAQEVHARLDPQPTTFVHGDFKADHLWVTADGLTLIDFDTCGRAEPALDVGKFLADLQWWYAAYAAPGVEQAQAHFLGGYAATLAAGDLQRARLYETLVLVKMTVHRVPLFRGDWAGRTTDLIRRAESILAVAMP
jgi:hypothetical protein